jgi:acyl-CoA reductase-like NAD-dependent aldehyde dehydrogenase
MGNTVVAKPSEITPVTATALAAAFAAAGAPPGVFNLVHGLGAEVGDALESRRRAAQALRRRKPADERAGVS